MERTDSAAFHRIIDATIAALPTAFQPAAQEVVVSVVDMPPRGILNEFEIRDPLALTGLYDGIPLTEKSVIHQPIGPDTIWLFRLPILAEWQDRGDVALSDLVAHVYIHELAHHFGWSDEDIAEIDQWWQ